MPDMLDTVPLPKELILLIDYLADGLITTAKLKFWTAKDPLLMKVFHFIRNDWPNIPIWCRYETIIYIAKKHRKKLNWMIT